MTRTMVFVCEHGAFRSRIAAAFFNAAAPTGWRAVSAGLDPQLTTSARLVPLLAGTSAAEHLETEVPRRAGDLQADRVIAVDCALGETEQWTTNAPSDEGLRDELASRVERLVLELGDDLES